MTTNKYNVGDARSSKLKEGDDERIKEALIKYFKECQKDADGDELFCGLSYNDILAWLERQGEQKPVMIRLKFKIGDVIKRKNSSVTYTVSKIDTSCFQLDGGHWLKLDRMSEFELVDKKTTDKVEQEFADNPDTLIEESNQQQANALIDMVTEEKDMIEYNKGFECGKQRVLKYPEDFGLCKKSIWSEEDERNLNEALSYIKDETLKTFIKNKVKPQKARVI